jgi:hypothetical protein
MQSTLKIIAPITLSFHPPPPPPFPGSPPKLVLHFILMSLFFGLDSAFENVTCLSQSGLSSEF